jgi:NADH:ubiquinone oxidoreductase subunit 2 (subunit N)
MKKQTVKNLAAVVTIGGSAVALSTQWPKLKAAWQKWSATQQFEAFVALLLAGYFVYKSAESIVMAFGEIS